MPTAAEARATLLDSKESSLLSKCYLNQPVSNKSVESQIRSGLPIDFLKARLIILEQLQKPQIADTDD